MNRNRLLSAAPVGVLAVALLAGCSTASDADAGRIDPADAGLVAPAPEADERSGGGSDDDGAGAATGGDPAARFLACVTDAGFEGSLDEWGNVRVVDDFAQQLLDLRLQASQQSSPAGLLDELSGDPRPGLAHIFGQGDDGRGVVVPVSAAYFTQDPVAAAAWAYCEAAHPDFEQPGVVVDEGDQAERFAIAQRDALDFARRARDAGHHWVADPMPGAPLIVLPAGLTEAELRAALADALDPDVWISFDALADLGFAWREVIGEFVGAALG